MPRPALTQEQKRDIRHRIRAAASKLYKEQGPEKISARGVATEAGVSVGTIYAHFGSLSDLFQSLWREPVKKLVMQMEQLASDIDDPKDRLEALLRSYVDFAENNPAVFRSSFLYVRPESVAPPPQVKLERDRFFQIYRSTIREGQGSGIFRSGDLDELTQTVISAVHGSLSLPFNLHRLALDTSNKVPNRMVGAMLEWISWNG